MGVEYKITVLCSWHEVKSGGFATALDAYEHIASMPEIGRDDVISIKVERISSELSADSD